MRRPHFTLRPVRAGKPLLHRGIKTSKTTQHMAFMAGIFVFGLVTEPLAANLPSEKAHHGDSHHGNSEVNWTSMDYRGGCLATTERYSSPPFIWSLINFSILAAGFIWAARKLKLSQAIRQRRAHIVQSLDDARRIHERAEGALRDIESRIAFLSEEIAKIRETALSEASAEKEQMIEEAEREAKRISQGAKEALDREVATLKERLEQTAATAAVVAAEKILKQKVSAEDHLRLQQDFLRDVAVTSPQPSTGGPRGSGSPPQQENPRKASSSMPPAPSSPSSWAQQTAVRNNREQQQ